MARGLYYGGGRGYATLTLTNRTEAAAVPTHVVCPLCGKGVKIHKNRGTISRHGHMNALGVGGGACRITNCTPGENALKVTIEELIRGLEYWGGELAAKHFPKFKIQNRQRQFATLLERAQAALAAL